jgi:hypothetical protein
MESEAWIRVGLNVLKETFMSSSYQIKKNLFFDRSHSSSHIISLILRLRFLVNKLCFVCDVHPQYRISLILQKHTM